MEENKPKFGFNYLDQYCDILIKIKHPYGIPIVSCVYEDFMDDAVMFFESIPEDFKSRLYYSEEFDRDVMIIHYRNFRFVFCKA
jgi:hypothetical protein